MAQHVSTGHGAPSAAPKYLGEHYIDVDAGDQYLASGTSAASDWKKIGGGGGGAAVGKIALTSETVSGFAYTLPATPVPLHLNGLPAAEYVPRCDFRPCEDLLQNSWTHGARGRELHWLKNDFSGFSWHHVATLSHTVRAISQGAGADNLVAVGDGGMIATMSTAGAPGQEQPYWFEVDSGTSEDLLGICYDSTNSVFVAVGRNGYIATSTDGSSWTTVTATITRDLVRAVAVPGVIVAFSRSDNSSNVIHKSTDGGTTWASSTTTQSNKVIDAIATGSTIFALFNTSPGNSAYRLYSTTDGDTWTTAKSFQTAPDGIARVPGDTSSVFAFGIDVNGDPFLDTYPTSTLSTYALAARIAYIVQTSSTDARLFVAIDDHVGVYATSDDGATISIAANIVKLTGPAVSDADMYSYLIAVRNMPSNGLLALFSPSGVKPACVLKTFNHLPSASGTYSLVKAVFINAGFGYDASGAVFGDGYSY